MNSLSYADWQRLSEALRSLYEPYSLEEFPARSLAALSTLVGAEIYGCSSGGFQSDVIPHHHTFPDVKVGVAAELFTTQHQQFLAHPVLAHYVTTSDGQARAISDFLSEQEFHRQELGSRE
jgi:hypothetical protein